jgi:hypothetical protein
MKFVLLAAVLLTVGAPSKTVGLAIVHTVRGCHVWQLTHDLGPPGSLKLRPDQATKDNVLRLTITVS